MERSRHAIVFDLGEVLASPADLAEQLASVAAVDPHSMGRAYWRHRLAHDEGQPAAMYWGTVLADLGVTSSARLVDRLVQTDATAWLTIRPDAFELLADLEASGNRVAILSNMPAELAERARRTEWAPFIDEWFFSGEMGVAKPFSEIYSRAAAGLHVYPERIVFFDDRQVNVTAAVTAGWDAYLWKSGAETRARLKALRII